MTTKKKTVKCKKETRYAIRSYPCPSKRVDRDYAMLNRHDDMMRTRKENKGREQKWESTETRQNESKSVDADSLTCDPPGHP